MAKQGAPRWLRVAFPATCLGLGIWQLYRWRRKEHMIASYLANVNADPVLLTDHQQITTVPRRYYLPPPVDSQVGSQVDSQLGSQVDSRETIEYDKNAVRWIGPRGHGKGYAYLAVSPHTLRDGTRVLLNLGWHDCIKSVSVPKTTCFIRDSTDERQSWISPSVPVKDIPRLASELGTTPIMLKAVREGETVSVPYSNKHVEYMLTWWSLGILAHLFGRH